MKFFNATVTAILAASALSACQGQNPLKRESNPVRNYPRVEESIRTRKGLQPYTQPVKAPSPPPDNSQTICSQPFAVSINGVAGTRLLKFPEDSLTRFEITLINRLGDEFEAKAAEGFPDSNVFRLLKKDKNSANVATYQISWNPKKLSSGQFTQIFNGRIEITSAALSATCHGVANIYLDLLVEKSGQRPTLSVSGLPQTAVIFGQESAFNIDVEDSVSSGDAPTLNALEFKAQAASAERHTISGVPAIDCISVPALVPNTKKWRFTCKFLSSALAEKDVKGLLNSNKTATAVAFISAKSQANQVSSNPHQINIKVKFEKAAAEPAAQTGDQK